MKTSWIVAALLVICERKSWNVIAASNWGYDPPNGPENWTSVSNICGGNSQSPINIVSTDVLNNESLGEFDRAIFANLPSSLNFTNTKNSLQVNVEDGYTIQDPMLLPADFKITQFHIHWAKPGERGSEHMLDGVQYFGEIHLVHYNMKYNSFKNASSQSDGLAVLGIFLEDNYLQDNLAFGRMLAPILDGNGSCYGDEAVALTPLFTLETLLPHDLQVYYRYKGSLTTPPCSENVLWTVFEQPLQISQAQAEILQTMVFQSDRGATSVNSLYGNFRPVQPLNGRLVTKSVKCPRGSVSFCKPTVWLLSLNLIIFARMAI